MSLHLHIIAILSMNCPKTMPMAGNILLCYTGTDTTGNTTEESFRSESEN